MMTFFHAVLALLAVWLISGMLINFSRHPHWYVRAWDFPRMQVAVATAVILAVYAVFFRRHWWDWVLIIGLVGVIVRQLVMIRPYLPTSPVRVLKSTAPDKHPRLRLLISNVLMDNREYAKWLNVVRAADADVIVAVELDQAWIDAVEPLKKEFPHSRSCPLGNFYGMIVMSRLQFDGEPELRFMVQDDIPSMHMNVRLEGGEVIRIHALHPRPPEPMTNQDSAPRDAELVMLGREIAERERNIPTIVCGDLNDVAWSYTTQLFLRLSKLLDPRMGRGMYNSFNANSRIFRYPLDHVFISNEFKMIDLRVLDHVGSDHFPILIELSCEPQASAEQPEPQTDTSDHEVAQEIIREQAERELTGEEKGHVSKTL